MANTKRIRIVIAHGRAATWDVPGTSKPSWTEALRFGIQRTNVPRAKVDALDVGYAAFGQLWRPDSIMPPADPTFAPEVLPTFELPTVSRIAHWFGQAGVLAPITGSALTRMLADVFDYLGPGTYFDDCNALVATACTEPSTVDGKPPTDVILVGFSLGAIVSYCTAMKRTDAPIRALITCGNPIGFGPIYPALEHRMGGTTPYPAGRSWTDIWCGSDAASAVHGNELEAKFPGGSILPLQTKTRPPGVFSWFASHAPFDYLSSTVMGQAVRDAITAIDPTQTL